MVGNAVPPRLAWYLAIQMKKAFADQMTISKEEKSQVQQTIKQVPIIKIAEEYPQYGWDRNMAYPTEEHREAIRRFGITPYHRRSYNLLGDETETVLF